MQSLSINSSQDFSIANNYMELLKLKINNTSIRVILALSKTRLLETSL